MKITLVGILSIIMIALSACAKHPSASVTAVNGNNEAMQSAQQPYSDNKFALGPHAGLLGVRQYYFKCSSTLLPTYYYKALRAHAAYLKGHSTAKTEIQGFTDAAGSREYNITVGQRRADAVTNYLRLQGVKAGQISEVSYGAEMDEPYTGKTQTKDCRVDLIYVS